MLGDDERLRFDTTDRPEFDDWRWVDYWHPVREVIYLQAHRVRAGARRARAAGVSGRPARVPGVVVGRRAEAAGAGAQFAAGGRAPAPVARRGRGVVSDPTIVRPPQPRWRRWLPFLAVAVLAVLAFGVGYQRGQLAAGLDAAGIARERRSLDARVKQLEADNSQLTAKAAELEMARRLDRDAYGQVERTLGDLQSQARSPGRRPRVLPQHRVTSGWRAGAAHPAVRRPVGRRARATSPSRSR